MTARELAEQYPLELLVEAVKNLPLRELIPGG